MSAPENPSRNWTRVSSSAILLEGGHLLAGEETCAIYRRRRRLSPESFHASPPRRPCTGLHSLYKEMHPLPFFPIQTVVTFRERVRESLERESGL